MPSDILTQLVSILAVGILSQWAAWRVRLPSILVLLATGTVVGPITGWLRPDTLFGDLLMPVVSLSVAVILYEGGLSLKFHELKQIGLTFTLLSTVGVAVTWLIGAVAAHYLLEQRWPVAALFGAILVVTGPTVIGPMLRHLRLRGKVSSLLKWEGIVVDPIGAMLAVSVFAVAQAVTLNEGVTLAIWDIGRTLLAGSVLGGLAAGLLILMISRFWIPDQLHNPCSLALMFAAFAGANIIHEESGLVAVTVMGIAIANQSKVGVRHVTEFKESLTILLISCLFIVLSARLSMAEIRGLDWRSFTFVVVMVLIARPVAVLASTWGSVLTWQERCFLCCMAPRGIVAAAITSVLALALVDSGYPKAVELVPITFLLVFMTVLLYGLVSRPLALWLGLIQTNPQGILFVGASAWTRELAKALVDLGIPTFLVDSGWDNIRHCRQRGLPAIYGSALAESTREEIDYAGLGRLLAVTSNEEVNSLVCLRYIEDFGRKECYQLPFASKKQGKHEAVSLEYHGRILFEPEWTFSALNKVAGDSPKVKVTKLTEDFDYNDYQTLHGRSVLPLFLMRLDGSLAIRTPGATFAPKAGETILSLVITSTDSIPANATLASVPPVKGGS